MTTRDEIHNRNQVINDLVVKWGEKTHVQEIELQPGTRVQESVVVPQRANQIEPLIPKRGRALKKAERSEAMVPVGKAKKLPEN
ncbi:hypothetical protein [Marinobacter apostichopi]|uniref:hypothetical protein n=1 Tax=Marinobacter apostichopi TaxID=3035454 RepID=UPI0025744FC7|nr:hypothetical protein [Marinobacter sp. LA51]